MDTKVFAKHLEDVRGNLIPKIFKYTEEVYGPNAHAEAWNAFTLNADIDANHEEESTVFLPWFIFNWCPTEETEVNKGAPKVSPANGYFKANSSAISGFEKSYLEECIRAPFSFYEITDIKNGNFFVKNVFTSTNHELSDLSEDSGMQKGDVFFAKLLSMEGITVMEGFSPFLLDGNAKEPLLDMKSQLKIDADKDLTANANSLFEMYHALTGKMSHDHDHECGGCSGCGEGGDDDENGCCGGGHHHHH